MRLLLVPLFLLSCSDDPLTRLTGALEVTAINAAPNASHVLVEAKRGDAEREASEEVARPGTVILLERMDPGSFSVRVSSSDRGGIPLQAVWIDGVEIRAQLVTELLVDLSDSPIPPPSEICNGSDDDGDGEVDELQDVALCAACEGGREVLLADDERCATTPCDADRFELRGSSCVAITQAISGRCSEIGRCEAASCVASEAVVATAGECQIIAGCEAGAPSIESIPGCPVDPPEPEIGCADGEREGFLAMAKYPAIAGCSGGWSLPGVTLDLTPACGRGAGDDSSNPAGLACNASDLCADGWHVCSGKGEVAKRSTDGCAAAVPPGAPDKSLFFAVRQSSLQGSTCTDDANGDNDVFGCGNLGNLLAADKNCAPLDRVLASTQPNSCGFNEAEPPLGPWQCLGSNDSHFHEGSLVTKSACANGDCTYDGQPVSTWDKGGVLCCRD